MSRPIIFLDDGGVMNANAVRGEQWRRLLGEFMPGVLGGAPDSWSEANRVVAGGIFEPDAWAARLAKTMDYIEFERAYARDWLGAMCLIVGVEAPSEEQNVEILHRASEYITCRVRASFPGVIEAIRTLHATGYTLHTASGEPSWDLTGYLTGMGVTDCFQRLYGPDLINTMKSGPEYYERLLAHAVVSPDEALFIDDSPLALSWAREAGARGVLVGDGRAPGSDGFAQIASLAELPAYLRAL